MKSYDVTTQMKALCLYFDMMLFVSQNFGKFGSLVEICLWAHLAVKGLKEKNPHFRLTFVAQN